VTIDVRRANNRARIEQPGIVTWHSFSAGPHYDPNNISFGALIAHDEHLLAAAAGFPKHAHRGVDIVSWVLDGELRHDGQTLKRMPGLIVHSGSCRSRCCRRT
jgi:redox-sensitive bicupin YhaK (pirin superfamily)